MKKKLFKVVSLLILISFVAVSISSCMTNHHTVGKGSQTGVTRTERQWYAAWGLVKIGNTDTDTMVKDTENYEIDTYFGGVDVLINWLLGWLSICTRTVTVTK